MDRDFERACGRAEDLMGFLYGELNEVEANGFRGHLQQCASCNSELSSFGNIRSSVLAWRNESFSSLSAPARANGLGQKRSAVMAIREFFNLSPVWMKVTVGFASLLFCALAVLAVVSVRQGGDPLVVKVETPPAADQIDMLVKQRVEDELRRIKAQTNTTVSIQQQSVKDVTNGRTDRTAVRPKDYARRPLTRVEREQLAADLRLTANLEDSELDLLDDTINQ
ncbi:MAG TPA: hypothetical protein VJV03_04050 [Pyrinomonadaceae bacterium]|nr:hypothetical protein [Pyrinomonadaceae bacterium]